MLGNVSTFSNLGGIAMVFGGFGSGLRLYLTDGNDTYELDGSGNYSTFSTGGRSSITFGNLGFGYRLFVSDANSIYSIDATGASQFLSGQGGNAVTIGDFGSGPRLYVMTSNTTYSIAGNGTSSFFSGLGGEDLVFQSLGVLDVLTSDPGRMGLSPAWPLPSRGQVDVALTMQTPGDVDITVFDAAGRRIAILADGFMESGSHLIGWDGRDAGGRPASAGVYFVQATGPGLAAMRRVVKVQ